MADWSLESGLYLLAIALIPGVGMLLICWGLWGDRSKGRTRCPKCWYDMRGTVPLLACPECTHDAKHERRLYRNRRRWWPIVLCVVSVLLLSYPLMIVGGWCREQVVVEKLNERGHAVDDEHLASIGPRWLFGQLPESLARPFDRVATVRLRPPGTDADLAECGKWSAQIVTRLGLQSTVRPRGRPRQGDIAPDTLPPPCHLSAPYGWRWRAFPLSSRQV